MTKEMTPTTLDQQVAELQGRLLTLFVKRLEAEAIIKECDIEIKGIRNILGGVELATNKEQKGT